MEDYKLPYCHSGPADCSDLLSAVQTLRPTVLIGCDQVGGPPPFMFDQHVIGAMADNVHHPLIFPLTSTVPECQLRDAYVWSGGRALVATCAAAHMGPLSLTRGVDEAGDHKELLPSQITSTYIFPGIGEYLLQCLAVTAAVVWSAAIMCDPLGGFVAFPLTCSIPTRTLSGNLRCVCGTCWLGM